MSKPIPKYDEDFKKSIVTLHQNGKSLSELSREYGVSMSAMSKWVKTYAEVKIDEDTIMTAKQVKELQKRNLMLEMVEYNKRVSVGKIYRPMKSMTLPKMSTVKPKAYYQKGSEENLKNLLNKEFNPKALNQVWVSDITYVKVSSRFVYICAIMDLFSRKILACKVGTSIDTRLVLDTFCLAYSKRGYPKGVMFHSDRGTQYTPKELRKALDEADFVQSFSAKGHPFDNAVMESFFRYLKHRELNRRTFNTMQELNLSLLEYIEDFYNKRRPYSANGFLSPNEKEEEYQSE